jgi:uncharacterized membrane protein
MTYQDLYDEQNKMGFWGHFLVITLFALVIAWFIFLLSKVPVKSNETLLQEQCREYASRDHQKELAPERYAWLGKEFVDNYDWYTSCLNHSKHPVAGNL